MSRIVELGISFPPDEKGGFTTQVSTPELVGDHHLKPGWSSFYLTE